MNWEKCAFNQSEIEFFGQYFSKDGMSLSSKKAQAIRDCQDPTCAKEVRSLLGMANFTSRYIKYYSKVLLVQPLTELTKKDVPWQWGDKDQRVLDIHKKTLTC